MKNFALSVLVRGSGRMRLVRISVHGAGWQVPAVQGSANQVSSRYEAHV